MGALQHHEQNFNNAVDSVVVQATGPDSLGGGNAATAAAVKNC